MHEFAELLGERHGDAMRRAFASLLGTRLTEMDVLRKFFYSPGDAPEPLERRVQLA